AMSPITRAAARAMRSQQSLPRPIAGMSALARPCVELQCFARDRRPAKRRSAYACEQVRFQSWTNWAMWSAEPAGVPRPDGGYRGQRLRTAIEPDQAPVRAPQ